MQLWRPLLGGNINFKLNKKEKNLKKEFNNLAKAFLEIKILKIKKNKKLRRIR